MTTEQNTPLTVPKKEETSTDTKPLTVAQKVENVKEGVKDIKQGTVKEKTIPTTKGKCYNYGFSDNAMAQEMIQYACDYSNMDVDFILTLNAENGGRDYKKQSNCYKVPGDSCASRGTPAQREKSYGMCQMHYSYQKDTVYEGLPYNRIHESRYLKDWKYQIEVCYAAYKGGTPMFGYANRKNVLIGNLLIGNKRY